MLLAFVLSLAVLLAFQVIFKPPAKKPLTQEKIVQGQEARLDQEAYLDRGITGQRAPRAVVSPARATESPTESLDENEAYVQTERYEIVFSDIGGDIKRWRLKEFADDEEELFIKAEDPAKRLFAMQSRDLRGLETSRFTLEQRQNLLKYTLKKEDVLQITKTYTFHNSNDYIHLGVQTKNLSPGEIRFSYQLTGPSGLQETGKVYGRSFLMAEAAIDEKLERKHSTKGVWEQQGDVSWVALKNRYFAAILKPFSDPASVGIEGDRRKGLTTFVTSQDRVIAPGGMVEEEYLLYAGPLVEDRLKAVGYGMERALDYGWFGGISKILLATLRFFHKGVKNWGVAIILLTMLVNAVTFPLTRKSFTSMKQMKDIQPHMQKLKELHKDNSQKLNKEMMELYKKYNVNPFGGCLPLLLQIPIFIGLYQGLIRSVELKGAGFLWIKNLAKPDAAPLPFSLPVVGNSLNILPLLMVGAMFLQQKFSQAASAAMTQEQAQQQKMMMIMMPVFFGFLFYNMPSGLVLYWLTNTVLMVSEQAFMTKSR